MSAPLTSAVTAHLRLTPNNFFLTVLPLSPISMRPQVTGNIRLEVDSKS